ncbi:MAG: hypothetical protein J0L62_17640 [Bacteroidetes bacterium]|nr:hypothetical protein [Bacteroidota bacterium]
MKSITIALSLILSTTLIMAQGTQSNQKSMEPKTNYTAIFGTLGLPTGDFAKVTGDNFGKAKTGFGIGILHVNEISPIVSFVIEGRFNYNSLDVSAMEEKINDSGISIDESGYKTFWGLGGFQINSVLKRGGRLYAKGLGGFVLGLTPRIELRDGGKSDVAFKVATAISFGFGIGCGYTIQDKILIEATYLSGKPEYTIKSEIENETYKTKMEHSIFSINLGFIF